MLYCSGLTSKTCFLLINLSFWGLPFCFGSPHFAFYPYPTPIWFFCSPRTGCSLKAAISAIAGTFCGRVLVEVPPSCFLRGIDKQLTLSVQHGFPRQFYPVTLLFTIKRPASF